MSRTAYPPETPSPPSLFDAVPFVEPAPAGSIEARFQAFHDANPWVYAELVNLARQLVARGHAKVGIKMLFEVLRWSWLMRTDDPAGEWKLNNSYTSRYARRIMAQEPDLTECFEVRELQTR